MAEQDFEERAAEKEQASIIKLSMQTLKMHYGLNPGKYREPVRSIGYQLGSELAKLLPQQEQGKVADVDDVVKGLAPYWMHYGIGEMYWVDKAEMLLAIQFCSDCLGRGYGAGYTICPFKEGLLEAVIKSKLRKNYHVEEVECCGTQATNCLFKIESILD